MEHGGENRTVSLSVRGIAGTLVVLAVAAICVRLGLWQLDRLRDRRVVVAALETRSAESPVELDASPRDSAGWLHRRVFVRGPFDHARSIVLPGRAYRGAPGVHVLTPVRLPGGDAVLVDRGWVPAADGATIDLDAVAMPELAMDTGLVMPFPRPARSRADAAPAPDPGGAGFRRVWFALDERALRAQFPYDLGATQVVLLPAAGVARYPVRPPPPALDDGPHLGYAIQWFSFAAIALIGWLVLLMKSGVARAGNRPH